MNFDFKIEKINYVRC